MRFGLLSGALWGLDTVVLGMALLLAPLAGAGEAALAGALIHDVACAVLLLAWMAARGRVPDTLRALRTRAGRVVVLAALLGGPFGMTGYLVAIENIGPGYTAIISSCYPAVGTFLARLLLKERMSAGQLVALAVALVGMVAVGWSSTSAQVAGSTALGVAAALACVIGWGSEAVLLAWGMREEAVDNETALHIRETTSALAYLVLVVPLAGALGVARGAMLTPAAGVLVAAALAGTVSYLFYYRAIGTIGASRGMALNISYSAWAVLFALALQGTLPSGSQVAGCAVILIGTILAATPQWRDLVPNRRRC